ncbi:methylmalonyl-CoA mutase family protein [Spirosoma flavum]|uniref:Methylmalonyl-CoA mutase family protein n=1 Tax=Spirosoma flavum TaxID=2048557 RepID=A0ABW6AM65_9BACT
MEPLFSTLFPATDKSVWQEQVRKELKPAQNGEDGYESLRWHTGEGFVLDPYYTASDLIDGPLTALTLETTQAAQKRNPGWLNAPERTITTGKADNIYLRDALTRGADALVLNIPGQANRIGDLLSRLLNGIKLSDTPVFFRLTSENATDFIQSLKTVAPYQLKGGLLMNTGNSTAEATRLTADSPQFRTICASSHTFHNAGATATQELAFTLASLADTYDQLTSGGLTIEQLVHKTMVSMSVGTSYFLEIAKLRALRVLLTRFLSAYSFSLFSPLFVHCQTSTFYDATTTYNTNLLRATTEAMAAVIGGCDVLTVHPYDAVLGKSTGLPDHEIPDNELLNHGLPDQKSPDSGFSDRIARNISVLLKDESYLDKVADPSAGSYYIETLTHMLVEAAWALFLDVEKQGGFSKALTNGFIQAEIERAYKAKIDAVRNGKVLVGVTKFRFDEPSNQKDKLSKNHPAARLVGSLPEHRLAEEFE